MKIIRRFVLVISVFFILIAILIMKFDINVNSQEKIIDKSFAEASQPSNNNLSFNDYMLQPDTNWGLYREKIEVKGIFITGNTLSYNPKLDKIIGLINDTELNSLVIDIKDDKGILTYASDVDIAEEIGVNNNVKVKDFKEKMELLRNNNIYTIARIVTFKDRIAGSKRPDLAIKAKDGSVWRDNKGNTWLNPYNKVAWEYPIQLAEEAALMGFKEIQFDYVRFPTDGNRARIDYGQAKEEMSKAEAIAAFLDYARERLEPKGVYVSADVFGDIINVKGDSGIGQHLETLALNTDVLCPMVYPSHYALGSYGVSYPDSNPYKIVYEAMIRAKKRIEEIKDVDTNKKAILRPWLQDFTAGWLKKDYGDHFISYGPEQIRAQIQATYDAGLSEWIFWDSANTYTEKGFNREDSNIDN